MESVIVRAFWAGLVSASSMPLGALTSRFWQPSDRVIGALTAFGAGALLAATMLDLVASAIEDGQIIELILGSIIGSVFFTSVNHGLNKYGGFLRKSATAAAHINRQQEKHLKQMLTQLGRLDIFRSLTAPDLEHLTQSLLISRYQRGRVLYQPDSACESLYLVQEGEVQLLDPEQEMQPFANLKPGDFFSRMAFFTGSPHRTSAIAKTDCEIAILPREAFEDLLETSPELNVATQRLVQGEEIAHYLQQRHYLTLDEVKNWVDQAIFDIQTKARIPDAISVENKADEFVKIARQVKRLPIFQYLPSEDIEAVANRLRYRRYKDGETLFYQNESSNELYIIHCGQIALSNPQNPSRKLKKLHPKDVVGEFSFLAGALHTVTAVADGDVGVWELSRIDFGELLKQSPELNQAVEKFLQQETVTGYLQRRQGFSPEQSAQWLEKAFDYLHGGKKPPSAQEMVQVLTEHKNAPLAIWAGLLIDGIPESLTIGANELAGAGVSATFVTGLFISNYPEALSSSDGMRQQGFSFARIFSMWTSVMLIQGILAGVGSLILSGAPESLVALIESIGAGAILTVMAETMLPEAYMRKGYWLGLSLLLGFLVIVLIKTLG